MRVVHSLFASHPEFDPDIYGGTIVLAESLDDLETAFQEAVRLSLIHI